MGYVDVAIAPWLLRFARVLYPYRAWPLPKPDSRLARWIDALEATPAVRNTLSGDELYLDSYERYAGELPSFSIFTSFFLFLLSHSNFSGDNDGDGDGDEDEDDRPTDRPTGQARKRSTQHTYIHICRPNPSVVAVVVVVVGSGGCACLDG